MLFYKSESVGQNSEVTTMDQSPPNRSVAVPTPSPSQSLHQSDADEDDENVKQLDECSSLYLSMQVILWSSMIFNLVSLIFPKTLNPDFKIDRSRYFIFNEDIVFTLQECLVESNRDWKACQMGISCWLSLLW